MSKAKRILDTPRRFEVTPGCWLVPLNEVVANVMKDSNSVEVTE